MSSKGRQNMKKLEIIQKVTNALRIAAKVVRIVLMVSMIIVAAVAVLALFVPPEFYSFIVDNAEDFSKAENIVLLVYIVIQLGFGQYFASLVEKYLTKEVSDGTPFTVDGARLMRKTGIDGLIISLASTILSGGLILISELLFKSSVLSSSDVAVAEFFGLSLFFLILSILIETAIEELSK